MDIWIITQRCWSRPGHPSERHPSKKLDKLSDGDTNTNTHNMLNTVALRPVSVYIAGVHGLGDPKWSRGEVTIYFRATVAASVIDHGSRGSWFKSLPTSGACFIWIISAYFYAYRET